MVRMRGRRGARSDNAAGCHAEAPGWTTRRDPSIRRSRRTPPTPARSVVSDGCPPAGGGGWTSVGDHVSRGEPRASNNLRRWGDGDRRGVRRRPVARGRPFGRRCGAVMTTLQRHAPLCPRPPATPYRRARWPRRAARPPWTTPGIPGTREKPPGGGARSTRVSTTKAAVTALVCRSSP